MRRAVFPILILAACATTPIQREMQVAETIIAINKATITALDYGIIEASDAKKIQGLTRAATAELKRAVAARRAGQSRDEVERILDVVKDLLTQARAVLEGK